MENNGQQKENFCSLFQSDSFLTRYIARQLPFEQQETFLDHIVGCWQCWAILANFAEKKFNPSMVLSTDDQLRDFLFTEFNKRLQQIDPELYEDLEDDSLEPSQQVNGNKNSTFDIESQINDEVTEESLPQEKHPNVDFHNEDVAEPTSINGSNEKKEKSPLWAPRYVRAISAIAAMLILSLGYVGIGKYLIFETSENTTFETDIFDESSYAIEVSASDGKLSVKSTRYHERLNAALLTIVTDPNNTEAKAIIAEWRNRVGLNPRNGIKIEQPSLTLEQERILLESKALFESGKQLGNTLAYEQAIEPLKQSVKLAIDAGVEKEAVEPLIILSNIYLNKKDYAKCLEYSYQLLAITAKEPDRSRIGGALQNIAMCCYSLGYTAIAMYTLDQLAQVEELPINRRAFSYSDKALILASGADITSAEHYSEIAMKTMNTMKSKKEREYWKTFILGYKAKIKAIAGKTTEAIEIYQQTLDLAKKVGINQDLMFAELNQGLGEALLIAGQCNAGKEKLIIAKSFYRQTKEQNDSLHKYTITNKSCDEQLKAIEKEGC